MYMTATVAWNPSKSYLGPKCTSSESIFFHLHHCNGSTTDIFTMLPKVHQFKTPPPPLQQCTMLPKVYQIRTPPPLQQWLYNWLYQKLPKVQNASTTATKVSGSLQLTFRNVTNMLLEGVVRIVSYVHVPLCDSLTNLKEISSWVMIAALFQPNSSITLVTPSTAQDSEGTVWKDEEKRCRSLSASEEDAYETWSGDMICVTARDIYSIAVKL